MKKKEDNKQASKKERKIHKKTKKETEKKTTSKEKEKEGNKIKCQTRGEQSRSEKMGKPLCNLLMHLRKKNNAQNKNK